MIKVNDRFIIIIIIFKEIIWKQMFYMSQVVRFSM